MITQIGNKDGCKTRYKPVEWGGGREPGQDGEGKRKKVKIDFPQLDKINCTTGTTRKRTFLLTGCSPFFIFTFEKKLQ